MSAADQKTARARIRRLLPEWEGGRWTVEGQGYAFKVRRFWTQIEGKDQSQYYFLLPWTTWDALKGLEDERIRQTLARLANRKRARLADGDGAGGSD